MSGHGRPRDPVLEEMRELYPDVHPRTLARWKHDLLLRAAAMDDATVEEKLAFIRAQMVPGALPLSRQKV